MKRYRVEFAASAKADIVRSFEWGQREWGIAAARRWYRSLKTSTTNLLGCFPLSQPLAPEARHSDPEVRQLILGRYRVLFEIEGKTVRVLHVRGAFVEESDQKDFEEADEWPKTTNKTQSRF